MRKQLIKATLAAVLVGLPAAAQAQDSPDLSTYLGSTQFYALGGSTFNVEFLFGRQNLSSSLFYQTDGVPGWTHILSTTGNINPMGGLPLPTVLPLPGTSFGAFTVGGAAISQTVTFALCTGTTTIFANCQVPGPFYTTSPSFGPSTNVRTLSRAAWNAVVPTGGAASTLETVFAFEDRDLVGSDLDYNDVVFSANLSTVVPEPSSVILMSVGLLGLAVAARRRNTKA